MWDSIGLRIFYSRRARILSSSCFRSSTDVRGDVDIAEGNKNQMMLTLSLPILSRVRTVVCARSLLGGSGRRVGPGTFLEIFNWPAYVLLDRDGYPRYAWVFIIHIASWYHSLPWIGILTTPSYSFRSLLLSLAVVYSQGPMGYARKSAHCFPSTPILTIPRRAPS